MRYRIPFNRPFIVGKELHYVAEAVLGGHSSGDGPFSRRCEALMQEKFGAHRVLLTTSCTSALEMTALLSGLEPGDEVILPSYTFVSAANAIHAVRAFPRFVEIRPDTLNLDEERIEEAINDRTRAIMPMHYAGVACEMDPILRIARKHRLKVIEDAAQGVNAKYKDRWLGTIGDFGTFSFHETKNYICGEGGALLVNDPACESRAEIIREKGTNRSQFFRGEVDKYTWVDEGSSYVPSDLLAAFLYAQLENMEAITDRRRTLYERYGEALGPLVSRGLIELTAIPEHCTTNYHMFPVLLKDAAERQALIERLKEKRILAVSHYVPLHSSPMGRALGYEPDALPVTERRSEQVLRLPFYWDLEEGQQMEIVDEIYRFFRVEPAGA
jgi:dTDP-4-amino-4,6-dideoxygalactose transaminase